MEYYKKPEKVVAFQWDGSNSTIKKINQYVTCHVNNGILFVNDNGDELEVPAYDWLVIDDKNIYTFNDLIFKQRYSTLNDHEEILDKIEDLRSDLIVFQQRVTNVIKID